MPNDAKPSALPDAHPLDALAPRPKMGTEPFQSDSCDLGFMLSDFWRWSTSDLTNNAMRGILAEFLVAKALDIKTDVRTEWDAYDLVTEDGLRIEVKSSAYLQTWKQTKLSKPCFTIGTRRGWVAATNTYAEPPTRSADIYVFALLHHKDKATVNPLHVNQWTFYVLPTTALNARFPHTKTIGLPTLISAGATAASYQTLSEIIKHLTQVKALDSHE